MRLGSNHLLSTRAQALRPGLLAQRETPQTPLVRRRAAWPLVSCHLLNPSHACRRSCAGTNWPDLHWDLNVQLTYWPFFTANRVEFVQSLTSLMTVGGSLREYNYF